MLNFKKKTGLVCASLCLCFPLMASAASFEDTKVTVKLDGNVVSNMDVPGHTGQISSFSIHRSSRYSGGHIAYAGNIDNHPVNTPYTITRVPPQSAQAGSYLDTLVIIQGVSKNGARSKSWSNQP
ncbi:hypothetical protein K0038_02324 [Pseudomonas syringae]|uniref:hypothetical protein n=1 Tax=Pseudomonas syringae TaxID=317 RepID=UPI001CA99B37|nr:hypothetical protein [Pseudomonas syringae]MCI3945285.1 hypothetical protein [Pseudomonas syringae]